jgi:hypothetical protein
MRALRSRLTYANVTATVALFLALGGGAYAATHLPKNSVGTRQLKKGAVSLSKIQSSAQNALKGRKGDQGPPGERGIAGQNATSLFAYILDQGASSAATVAYGKGVTSVSDPEGDSSYTVTFDRDLTHCVAFATTGRGDPSGAAAGGTAFGEFVDIVNDESGQVGVELFNNKIEREDGSFMIAAYC